MKVPNFVHDKAVYTEGPREGQFTEQWMLFVSQLIDQMQANVSNEGIVIPSQTTDDIAIIAASSQAQNGVRFLTDSTTNELKAIVNGVVKTVTLT